MYLENIKLFLLKRVASFFLVFNNSSILIFREPSHKYNLTENGAMKKASSNLKFKAYI